MPQTQYGDYNRTFTLETALQAVMERLAVPKLLARRVPTIYGLLLTWIDEDLTGAAWNYSKPLISYPPIKCFPPGDPVPGSAGADLPAFEHLSIGDLTGNTITADRITLHGTAGTTVITGDGLVAQRNADIVAAAPVVGNLVNISRITVPLYGDQSQAWCKVTANAAFSAALQLGDDCAQQSYLPCLTNSTSRAGLNDVDVANFNATPVSPPFGGVVIMANCAPAFAHSIGVRVFNPSGVLEVTTCGYSDATPQTVYCVRGPIVYSGNATANTLQLAFSTPVDIKYGVQQLRYGAC